ncbi:extracellular solute-binding protein [Gryllotalpicola protaetiae]|uniref:Extracellular solute-binding protein n=1 Tax=Gryllotalpicola protaetiae TaxID=2419771 RepID=A0A387BWK8_9MICO|nr:extracellular solute-binding protein [Gryllotalpicola protaetiae]
MRRLTRTVLMGSVAAAAAFALAGCGSGFGGNSNGGGNSSGSGGLTSSKDPLTVLIGSSGDAETAAVTSAVADWSSSSGTKATVIPASNLDQQLAQGFAAKKPADVFYLSTGSLPGYAANGSLLAYGSKLPSSLTSDFYPSLVKNFTYDGKLYCAPKDFSTLQLIVNTDDWQAAGLTDADYPKTWDQLSADAKKLTSGSTTGLVVSGQYERLGAFMVEAGGNLTNADSTKVTANSQANVDALTYAQGLLKDGSMKFAADVGAGWGGEAFGKNLGAMTIEGNWISGAMSSDYPSVHYKVVPLPAGPKGMGTLQFTNCWGIAADSPNQKAALALVEKLTSKDDQLAFAKAFGVMPSIQSAASEWKQEFPQYAPFLDASDYAQGTPTLKGVANVITDLDGKIAQLKTTDPKTILDSAQSNLQALLK